MTGELPAGWADALPDFTPEDSVSPRASTRRPCSTRSAPPSASSAAPRISPSNMTP